MSKENLIVISTEDSCKIYEYPIDVEIYHDHNLYELRIEVFKILTTGEPEPINRTFTLHVEKRTLEDAGVILMNGDRPIDDKPTETIEDLVFRLFQKIKEKDNVQSKF